MELIQLLLYALILLREHRKKREKSHLPRRTEEEFNPFDVPLEF